MNSSINIAISEAKIFLIRGKHVMLDKDLASIYGVPTKRLSEQVKRNQQRFPQHFMFQLTNEEWIALRSQNATLNISDNPTKRRGAHSKYLPYVFTEHGVSMLSAVLKSPLAIQVSIQIIEAFVHFRSIIYTQDSHSWIRQTIGELSHQLQDHEKKIAGILNQMNKTNAHLKQGIFFNNQIFDAYAFSSDLIKSAKKSLVLIDNYIDETTLLQLSKRKENVTCVIYTERITPAITLDLEKHNSQYSSIAIRILKNVHDRFLIIDNKELYHLGASLKDLGKRWFAFSRIDGFLNEVQSRLK
jgi:hypothetical protein